MFFNIWKGKYVLQKQLKRQLKRPRAVPLVDARVGANLTPFLFITVEVLGHHLSHGPETVIEASLSSLCHLLIITSATGYPAPSTRGTCSAAVVLSCHRILC